MDANKFELQLKVGDNYIPIGSNQGENYDYRFSTFDENLSQADHDQYILTFSVVTKIFEKNQVFVHPLLSYLYIGAYLRLYWNNTYIDLVISGVSPKNNSDNTQLDFTAQDEVSYMWSRHEVGYTYSTLNSEGILSTKNIYQIADDVLQSPSLVHSGWKVVTRASVDNTLDPYNQSIGYASLATQFMTLEIEDSNPYNVLIEACNTVQAYMKVDFENRLLDFFRKNNIQDSGYRYHPERNLLDYSVDYDGSELCTMLHVSGGDGITMIPTLPFSIQKYVDNYTPKIETEWWHNSDITTIQGTNQVQNLCSNNKYNDKDIRYCYIRITQPCTLKWEIGGLNNSFPILFKSITDDFVGSLTFDSSTSIVLHAKPYFEETSSYNYTSPSDKTTSMSTTSESPFLLIETEKGSTITWRLCNILQEIELNGSRIFFAEPGVYAVGMVGEDLPWFPYIMIHTYCDQLSLPWEQIFSSITSISDDSVAIKPEYKYTFNYFGADILTSKANYLTENEKILTIYGKNYEPQMLLTDTGNYILKTQINDAEVYLRSYKPDFAVGLEARPDPAKGTLISVTNPNNYGEKAYAIDTDSPFEVDPIVYSPGTKFTFKEGMNFTIEGQFDSSFTLSLVSQEELESLGPDGVPSSYITLTGRFDKDSGKFTLSAARTEGTIEQSISTSRVGEDWHHFIFHISHDPENQVQQISYLIDTTRSELTLDPPLVLSSNQTYVFVFSHFSYISDLYFYTNQPMPDYEPLSNIKDYKFRPGVINFQKDINGKIYECFYVLNTEVQSTTNSISSLYLEQNLNDFIQKQQQLELEQLYNFYNIALKVPYIGQFLLDFSYFIPYWSYNKQNQFQLLLKELQSTNLLRQNTSILYELLLTQINTTRRQMLVLSETYDAAIQDLATAQSSNTDDLTPYLEEVQKILDKITHTYSNYHPMLSQVGPNTSLNIIKENFQIKDYYFINYRQDIVAQLENISQQILNSSNSAEISILQEQYSKLYNKAMINNTVFLNDITINQKSYTGPALGSLLLLEQFFTFGTETFDTLYQDLSEYKNSNEKTLKRLYEEFGPYIYEQSYENTDELDSQSLYNQAIVYMADLNKPKSSHNADILDIASLEYLIQPKLSIGNYITVYNPYTMEMTPYAFCLGKIEENQSLLKFYNEQGSKVGAEAAITEIEKYRAQLISQYRTNKSIADTVTDEEVLNEIDRKLYQDTLYITSIQTPLRAPLKATVSVEPASRYKSILSKLIKSV